MFRLNAIHNVEIVAEKIRKVGGGMREYMAETLNAAMTQDVRPIWDKHISLAALSKDELAALDYPYATRHGIDSGPDPDYDVHTVSGSMVAGTRVENSAVAGNPAVQLICDSPHYEFIRYGTRWMRPRDPGGQTLAEALPAIQSRFESAAHGATIEFFGS